MAVAIAQVEDPEVRAKLTPSTPWGCMRPLFSNDYYPTYNRPNVELVTEPIEQRRHNPGLEPGRVDVIVGGAVVLVGVMRHWGFDEMVVSVADQRTGMHTVNMKLSSIEVKP